VIPPPIWISIVVAVLLSVPFGVFVESLTYAQLRSVLTALGMVGIWSSSLVAGYCLRNWSPFKRAPEVTHVERPLTYSGFSQFADIRSDPGSGGPAGTCSMPRRSHENKDPSRA
jgi:hypothetical protein